MGTEFETKSNLTEKEDALMVLGIIFLACQNINEKTWQDFQNKLINGESCTEHKVFHMLKEVNKICTTYLLPGQLLYRARTLSYKDLDLIMQRPCWQNLIDTLKKDFPIMDSVPEYNDNLAIFFAMFASHKKSLEESKKVIKQWYQENKNNKFWGFDATASGSINNVKNIKEGRLNKSEQRHLYAAGDIATAITEIRPVVKQSVSVAEIKILQKLKMYDFTEELLTKDFKYMETDYATNMLDFSFISEKCSMPNFGDENPYIATQAVSDYIFKLGFDGIIYPSALNSGGKNYLIFDTKNIEAQEDEDNATYQILNSKIYSVNDTKIDFTLDTPRNIGI